MSHSRILDLVNKSPKQIFMSEDFVKELDIGKHSCQRSLKQLRKYDEISFRWINKKGNIVYLYWRKEDDR